jgi:hypothetical protein
MAADATPSKPVEDSSEHQSTGLCPPAPQPQTVDDQSADLHQTMPPLPSRPTRPVLTPLVARSRMKGLRAE